MTALRTLRTHPWPQRPDYDPLPHVYGNVPEQSFALEYLPSQLDVNLHLENWRIENW